jgi:predicted GNAT superfamily acetyltransferase
MKAPSRLWGEAQHAAEAAANDAGVKVRSISETDDLRAACRLLNTIWQSDSGDSHVATSLLRALSKVGYVAGVFDGGGLIGACAGFFSAPARNELHSHIAGLSSSARGRGVGWAMKLHQRAWALGQEVTTVTWTFDPLVSRNAYFNVVKLGGTPVQYLPDFYGSMDDVINGTEATDRLLLRWDLTTDVAARASVGMHRRWDAATLRETGAVTALTCSPELEPVPGKADGRIVLVEIPPDIEVLRRTDPARAAEWRMAVRHTLGRLLDQEAAVLGFDRAGRYVLDRGGTVVE